MFGPGIYCCTAVLFYHTRCSLDAHRLEWLGRANAHIRVYSVLQLYSVLSYKKKYRACIICIVCPMPIILPAMLSSVYCESDIVILIGGNEVRCHGDARKF